MHLKKHHRRLDILLCVGGVLWLTITARLVQVQGFQYAEFASMATEQHQRTIDLKANRGVIFDRVGRELAVDVNSVSFHGDPVLMSDPAAVAGHFATFSGMDRTHILGQLRSGRRFVYLARQLDDTIALQARKYAFPGVFEDRETRRYYPYGPLAGQLIGYTDIDNVGSEGLERSLNGILNEENGLALCFVDAFGRQVPGLVREHTSPSDGQAVTLTIDAELQGILEEELIRSVEASGAESAIGVITDPGTGAILAMANVPIYNPNRPGDVGAGVRRNRAVTDPFEPGSTFKIISMAAALEDGLATLEEEVFCESGEYLLQNGDVIRDHIPYEVLTVAQVIERSSNIGTIKIAKRLQRKRLYEFIRHFGFGTRTGIELPAESAGILQHVGKWSERSLETIAIGQEIGVTALQLAQAFGAVANGGELMAPQIVRAIRRGDGTVLQEFHPNRIRRVISKKTASMLKAMMAGVVRRGTGSRAAVDQIEVVGKTGTAQQAAVDGAGYDPNRSVASFVGFAPADNPRILCLIAVANPQDGQWGGTVAAPAFKRVLERIVYQSEDHTFATTFADTKPNDVTRAPDLRGLRRNVAIYQAGLRGMLLVFSGEGEIVLSQDPVADTAMMPGKTMRCRMGSPKTTLANLNEIPMRQAALLNGMLRTSAIGRL